MKPDRALNLRLSDMPFEQLLQFQEDMSEFRSNFTIVHWRKLKAVIASASDWTEDELGQLTTREVLGLLKEIRSAPLEEQSDAIPPQTGTPSEPTEQASEGASPAG